MLSRRFSSAFLVTLVIGVLGAVSSFALAAKEGEPIELKTVAGLRFDPPRFVVKPGAKVKVQVENTDDMAHNFVITAPGGRMEVVNAAMTMPITPEQTFIPQSDKILFHTPVLIPGKSAQVEFTAPAAEGVYPYVCTYPGHGMVNVDKETLMKCWAGTADERGVALLLEPTPEFYTGTEELKTVPSGFGFLFQYLSPYSKYLFQVILGMLFGSMVSMLFPFLTQSLVDYGIQLRNVGFIYLILFSQLLLFLGNIGVDMIRNWVLLHVNTRLSVSIVSNFLTKLMKLPINFFESKNIGDISQRISDHHRIEEFLTGSSLTTLFSFINLIVFSVVLAMYDVKLLSIFFIGSIISISWVFIFLKQRKNLDYLRFQRLRENQNSIYELITGMQEIKLNNCEQARRWEWEKIQAKLFKINIKSLSLEQYQEMGASFFTQLKNILISFVAAKLVLDNQITLGAMLGISYIIGQMNGPLNQIMDFVKKIQDAKMSLDRLGEIHNKPTDE